MYFSDDFECHILIEQFECAGMARLQSAVEQVRVRRGGQRAHPSEAPLGPGSPHVQQVSLAELQPSHPVFQGFVQNQGRRKKNERNKSVRFFDFLHFDVSPNEPKKKDFAF